MNKQLYYISDQLQTLIDWENIYPMPRCAGGHDEQMKGLFKGARVLAHWNENSYQGTVATCVKLPDGRFLAYNDYYGSCSGCDSWEGASDEEVKKLCIDLANSALIFESLQDMVVFLSQEKFDIYEWNYCAKPLLELLNFYSFFQALTKMGFKYDGKGNVIMNWFGFKVVLYETFPDVTIELHGTDGTSKCGTFVHFDIPDCIHGIKTENLINTLINEAIKPSFEVLVGMLKDKISKTAYKNTKHHNV